MEPGNTCVKELNFAFVNFANVIIIYIVIVIIVFVTVIVIVIVIGNIIFIVR